MEEKQRYLANVRAFCSLSRNDWHRVYLVRRIASQYGMEFAQKLVTDTQFNWVFPAEILKQVKESGLLGDGSALLFALCCFGPFVLLCGSGGLTVLGLVLRMAEEPAASSQRLKCCSSWGAEEILPCPKAARCAVLTVGFSLCRYRAASLITSIVTWRAVRITERCVTLWAKP